MRRLAPLLLVSLALVPARALAVWVDLTPEQIRAAIEHGTTTYEAARKERRPADNLDPGYVVDLGPDTGQAFLYTEFSALALEARRYLAIGQAMKPVDIERVMADARGTLSVLVNVLGPKRDFLRHYRVALVQGDRRVAPLQSDIYRGSRASEASEAHRVPAIYKVRSTGIDPNAPVTLVLQGDEREIRFPFDLPGLR